MNTESIHIKIKLLMFWNDNDKIIYLLHHFHKNIEMHNNNFVILNRLKRKKKILNIVYSLSRSCEVMKNVDFMYIGIYIV